MYKVISKVRKLVEKGSLLEVSLSLINSFTLVHLFDII